MRFSLAASRLTATVNPVSDLHGRLQSRRGRVSVALCDGGKVNRATPALELPHLVILSATSVSLVCGHPAYAPRPKRWEGRGRDTIQW
jgi:hypothetical protein